MTPLRVAVDARRLQDRPWGGVGRYLAHVLPRLGDDVELVVLTHASYPPPDLGEIVGRVQPLWIPPLLPETAWIHGAVPWWLRSWDGVFHGTFNSVPLVGSHRSVVTIHDLSWEHHPEGFSRSKRRMFQIQARSAARQARCILTPTEAVKQDVCATYGVEPAQVLVSPNAVDPAFHPRDPAETGTVLAAHGIEPPYVIALGGAPRRGLPVAVEAWRRSCGPARGLQLVVVGPEDPGPGSGARWTGKVPDATWAALLAGAEAFCYPTRFEGFGMPALEAAASGTPVVCARLEPLIEILGGAAEWCDGPTAPAIQAGLDRVLGDDAHRRQLVEDGLARAAAAPGWSDAAAAVLRAYQMAAA